MRAGTGAAATPCPAGSYCPQASTSPTACPVNTDCPDLSRAVSACVNAGGYYGPAGAAAAACPESTYCPAGVSTAAKACPAHTASGAVNDNVVNCQAVAGYRSLVKRARAHPLFFRHALPTPAKPKTLNTPAQLKSIAPPPRPGDTVCVAHARPSG